MGEPSDAEKSDTGRSGTARSAAFGALLRSRRLGRGLTQEELAERAGLSVRSIGDLERGRAIPHRRTIALLAEALELAGAPAEQFRATARAAWVRHTDGAPEPQTAAGPRPAQLPHGPSDFVGRGAELAALREFRAAHRLRNAVGVCVLEGPAGVGKSALAVHFARGIADEFPDGQLFADLRGFDPHQPPLPPAAVLGRFLRALGVDPRRTSADPDELAGLFRSALADQRLLIVLDNAASTDQVRALLPGAPGCLVVATTRRHLAGLAARDGAHRVTLDTLDHGAALDLLRGVIDGARAAHEPGALDELARLCGHLPLALRIAGERVRTRETLHDLVGGLSSERERLDLLATDDDNTSVRAVFSWTYRALEPAAGRLFRLLGAHPGQDFTTPAAAALADLPPARVRRLMDRLIDCHLVEPSQAGRYRFHDLTRAYAAERLAADEPEGAFDTAARRLVRWYLSQAVSADLLVAPQRWRAPTDTEAAVAFGTRQDAIEWCDAESGNLISVVRLAVEVGDDIAAWQLPWALASYFDLRQLLDDWTATHELGLEAARRAADPLGAAAMLTGMGSARYYPRHFDEASDLFLRARPLWREAGEHRGEGIILNALGNISLETRQLVDAISLYRQALDVQRATGDRRGEGITLNNLAETYCELGRFDEVLTCALPALAINRETGNRRTEAFTLCHLGRAVAATATFEEAEPYLLEALGLGRSADDRHVQAWALDYLGRAALAAGHRAQAAEHWTASAALFTALRDPQAEEVTERLAALPG